MKTLSQEFEMQSQAGRIVVAYDGSEQSGAALDWAATEAQRRRRPLTVMHVLDYWSLVPGPVALAPWSNPKIATAGTTAREGAARAQKLAGSVDIETLTRVGRVSELLVGTSTDADLMVVGTRGHGDLVAAVLGSVAYAVTAHARCPVVVVRGDSTEPPGPDRPVVVGVDDSPGADAALQYGADIAAAAGATLSIVTVYRPLPTQDISGAVCFGYLPDDAAETGADTETRLIAQRVAAAAARKASARQPQLTVQTQTLVGTTVGQLTTAAHRGGLLVVGSRDRGGFAGLMLGSVGHSLIQAAPCPVAVVHKRSSPQPDQPVDVTARSERSDTGTEHESVGGVR
jgi:nucleotide-binding universal stress UspA family protein